MNDIPLKHWQYALADTSALAFITMAMAPPRVARKLLRAIDKEETGGLPLTLMALEQAGAKAVESAPSVFGPFLSEAKSLLVLIGLMVRVQNGELPPLPTMDPDLVYEAVELMGKDNFEVAVTMLEELGLKVVDER